MSWWKYRPQTAAILRIIFIVSGLLFPALPSQAADLDPTYVNMVASPQALHSGELITLSWTTANATYCYAYEGWQGSRPPVGKETFVFTGNNYFTLRCGNQNSYGTGTGSVAVTVLPPGAPSTGIPARFTASCSAYPPTGGTNTTYSFAAGSFGGQAPLYYSWSGDVWGGQQTMQWTFTTDGLKTARVRITDGRNLTAEATCAVQVGNVAASPPSQNQFGFGTPLFNQSVNMPIVIKGTGIVLPSRDLRYALGIGPTRQVSDMLVRPAKEPAAIIASGAVTSLSAATFDTQRTATVSNNVAAVSKTEAAVKAGSFNLLTNFLTFLTWYMILLVVFGIIFFLVAAALKRRKKTDYVVSKPFEPVFPTSSRTLD